MRKINVSTYVALDGVTERPERWSLTYFSEDAAKHAHDQLFASDALLMGRRTYEGFAPVWPTMRTEEGDFADRMNTLPKYVASTTLAEPLEWNNSTLLEGDVPAVVAKLKAEPGQDILVYGSDTLVRSLLEHDLVDELRLWFHPVIAGSGAGLFKQNATESTLKHVDTKLLSSGVVILSYAPAGAPSR
jgi:dihydrofolate reductase